jgi:hypothetical protein
VLLPVVSQTIFICDNLFVLLCLLAFISFCIGYRYTAPSLGKGLQTLFVNAAIEGGFEETQRLPWLVEVILP